MTRLDEIGVMTAADEPFFAREPTVEELHALFWTPGALAALAAHEQQIIAREHEKVARRPVADRATNASTPLARASIPATPETTSRPILSLPISAFVASGCTIQLWSAGAWHDVVTGHSRDGAEAYVARLQRSQPHVRFRIVEIE
jgi:hypothetical protein